MVIPVFPARSLPLIIPVELSDVKLYSRLENRDSHHAITRFTKWITYFLIKVCHFFSQIFFFTQSNVTALSSTEMDRIKFLMFPVLIYVIFFCYVSKTTCNKQHHYHVTNNIINTLIFTLQYKCGD